MSTFNLRTNYTTLEGLVLWLTLPQNYELMTYLACVDDHKIDPVSAAASFYYQSIPLPFQIANASESAQQCFINHIMDLCVSDTFYERYTAKPSFSAKG